MVIFTVYLEFCAPRGHTSSFAERSPAGLVLWLPHLAAFGARCGYFSSSTSVSLPCFVRDWTLRDVVSWDIEFCSRLSSRFMLFSSSFKHEAV